MTQTAIHKKLRFQPGQTALVINCPQAYAELLGALPEEVDFIQAASGTADFVHLFVRNRAELEKYIDTALSAIQYDGLLWISYPKGAAKVETDLNRDSLWELLKGRGIRPVTQISINETWSAMRFRPVEAVGK